MTIDELIEELKKIRERPEMYNLPVVFLTPIGSFKSTGNIRVKDDKVTIEVR